MSSWENRIVSVGLIRLMKPNDRIFINFSSRRVGVPKFSLFSDGLKRLYRSYSPLFSVLYVHRLHLPVVLQIQHKSFFRSCVMVSQ